MVWISNKTSAIKLGYVALIFGLSGASALLSLWWVSAVITDCYRRKTSILIPGIYRLCLVTVYPLQLQLYRNAIHLLTFRTMPTRFMELSHEKVSLINTESVFRQKIQS